jgi:hypothetical protein
MVAEDFVPIPNPEAFRAWQYKQAVDTNRLQLVYGFWPTVQGNMVYAFMPVQAPGGADALAVVRVSPTGLAVVRVSPTGLVELWAPGNPDAVAPSVLARLSAMLA